MSAGGSSSSYGSARFAGRLRESPDAHGSCKGPNSHARYGYEPGVGLRCLLTSGCKGRPALGVRTATARPEAGQLAGSLVTAKLSVNAACARVGGPLLRYGSEP